MIKHKIYCSVSKLPDSWDALVSHDVFLKKSFLSALEHSSPENITPLYVGFFKADKLIAVVIMQRVEMYLENIFRNANDKFLIRKSKQLISKIAKTVKASKTTESLEAQQDVIKREFKSDNSKSLIETLDAFIPVLLFVRVCLTSRVH